MSPEYFKKALRPYEAEAFMKGVEQAGRASWEQTRMQMFSSLAPWSKNLKPSDLLSFTWDDETKVEATKEEIDNAREWAKEAANILNRKYGR